MEKTVGRCMQAGSRWGKAAADMHCRTIVSKQGSNSTQAEIAEGQVYEVRLCPLAQAIGAGCTCAVATSQPPSQSPALSGHPSVLSLCLERGPLAFLTCCICWVSSTQLQTAAKWRLTLWMPSRRRCRRWSWRRSLQLTRPISLSSSSPSRRNSTERYLHLLLPSLSLCPLLYWYASLVF